MIERRLSAAVLGGKCRLHHIQIVLDGRDNIPPCIRYLLLPLATSITISYYSTQPAVCLPSTPTFTPAPNTPPTHPIPKGAEMSSQSINSPAETPKSLKRKRATVYFRWAIFIDFNMLSDTFSAQIFSSSTSSGILY